LFPLHVFFLSFFPSSDAHHARQPERGRQPRAVAGRRSSVAARRGRAAAARRRSGQGGSSCRGAGFGTDSATARGRRQHGLPAADGSTGDGAGGAALALAAGGLLAPAAALMSPEWFARAMAAAAAGGNNGGGDNAGGGSDLVAQAWRADSSAWGFPTTMTPGLWVPCKRNFHASLLGITDDRVKVNRLELEVNKHPELKDKLETAHPQRVYATADELFDALETIMLTGTVCLAAMARVQTMQQGPDDDAEKQKTAFLRALLEEGADPPRTELAKIDAFVRSLTTVGDVRKIVENKIAAHGRPSTSTNGAHTFSVVDLSSGFHQVPMNAADRWKTAFKTPSGLWEWIVMPMGLKNAPATFQRFMNAVLEPLRDCCVAFTDDIIIFSKTPGEHQLHLDKLFGVFEERNIFLSPSKSSSFQTQIDFLGHRVVGGGITPIPARVDAIADMAAPATVGELRSFLGTLGFFRRFIVGYAARASALTDLLRKADAASAAAARQPAQAPEQAPAQAPERREPNEQAEAAAATEARPAEAGRRARAQAAKSKGIASSAPIVLTAAARAAFDDLRRALTTAPVLLHADTAKPFIVTTDASAIAWGAVLLQDPDGTGPRMIECISHRFQGAEENWSAYDKEAAAVIGAADAWGHLLLDPFVLYTDNVAVSRLLTQQRLNERQVRWLEQRRSCP